jgi:hypothetical protein
MEMFRITWMVIGKSGIGNRNIQHVYGGLDRIVTLCIVVQNEQPTDIALNPRGRGKQLHFQGSEEDTVSEKCEYECQRLPSGGGSAGCVESGLLKR